MDQPEDNQRPSEEGFIAPSIAASYALSRRVNAHLAEALGKIKPSHNIGECIGEEDQRDGKAVCKGFARCAGKRPGRELRHKGRAADHPPQHAPATAKIIAGGAFSHALKGKGNADNQCEIGADDEIFINHISPASPSHLSNRHFRG